MGTDMMKLIVALSQFCERDQQEAQKCMSVPSVSACLQPMDSVN